MARKNVNLCKIVNAHSTAATFTSTPTIIRYDDNIAYQINVTTSTSSGTFSVQGSLDYTVSAPTNAVTAAGNWVDLTFDSVPTVAGANVNLLFNLNQVPYNALRIKYTSTVAGTGTCDIYVMSRQVGG